MIINWAFWGYEQCYAEGEVWGWLRLRARRSIQGKVFDFVTNRETLELYNTFGQQIYLFCCAFGLVGRSRCL